MTAACGNGAPTPLPATSTLVILPSPSPTATHTPTPLATDTPIPPTATIAPTPTATIAGLTVTTTGLHFYWPATIPADFHVNVANSFANETGYVLEMGNYAQGTITRISGGTEADRYPYCAGAAEPITIRNVPGCYPVATGGGFAIEWKEDGVHYIVGGIGNAKAWVTEVAENLILVDLATWQAQLEKAK